MRTRTLVVVPVAVVTALLVPGQALAHPVGVPGTPTCFGQRMSHAASDHGNQLKDRMAGLQAIVDEGLPEAVALFGTTVSPAEAQDFVRVNCSDTPYVPS